MTMTPVYTHSHTEFAGSILGVFLNKISPNWLIILFLVVTLSISTYYSYMRAWMLYREEELADSRAQETQQLMSGGGHQATTPRHYTYDDDETQSQELRTILRSEKGLDYRWLAVVTLVWVLVFVCSSLKELLTTCGTWEYFILAFLPLPIIVILSWHTGNEVSMHTYMHTHTLIGLAAMYTSSFGSCIHLTPSTQVTCSISLDQHACLLCVKFGILPACVRSNRHAQTCSLQKSCMALAKFRFLLHHVYT
jgi:hypothetical protein